MSALAALRERLNRYGSAVEDPGVLPLALPSIDDRLPRGGLPLGRLHRVAGAGGDPAGAAATGFAARLLARLQRRGPVLWCATADDLYPPALAALGLDPDRLILVRPRDETGVLAVVEEALRTRGFGAVLAEAARADLLAERRLQLACESHGTTALLLQRRPIAPRAGRDGIVRAGASAAVTRWTVAPAPSGGTAAWVGPARWALDLTHSRGGLPGRWIVETEDGTDRLAVVAELADHATETVDAPDAWPAEPVAIVETVEQRRQVVAVDDRGWAAGIRPRQKATDARAVLPGLALIPADHAADARALARLVRWAGRYSPAAAPCPPDGLWLDITGCAHLWGGEDGLVADLAARLQRWGLPARIAVAGSFGAAWALAHHDRSDRRILPDGAERAALAPLPMAALRLDEEEVAALQRIGLTRIGELLAAPRPGLARRFGAGPLLRLDQALGRAEETVGFRRPPTSWFARLAFAEPIGTPEDLQRAIAALAADLCARLEARMMGAAQFTAAFHRVDGRCQGIAIRTALPVRDPARVGRLLADRLDRVDPGFGVEVATLRADRVAPVGGRQSGLSKLEGEGAGIGDLAGFVDIVGNRIGFDRIWRPAAVESHLPERCVAARPPLAPDQAKPWPPGWVRPLRLLRRPEPIEAIAQVPDDPPSSFRWAGATHRIRRADGPERIAYEWWRRPRPRDRDEPDMIRDYYRVEDETGRRFWVYRAGLYHEGETARWFLHGMFD